MKSGELEAMAAQGTAVRGRLDEAGLKLAGLVPAGCRRILEFGRGDGPLAEAIKAAHPGVSYSGVSGPDGFDWRSLSGALFDCIILDNVLDKLIDAEEICAQAVKLLAPGGSLLCRLPNIAHWSVVSGLLAGNWAGPGADAADARPRRFFTLSVCKELLDACGLYMAKEDHLGEPPAIPAELGPYLQKVNVEVRGFLERSAIREFLFRAERVPYAPSAAVLPSDRGASWNPAARNALRTVTVIIPVFNKVDLTRDCLISIARHYPESIAPEILVFDNASGDGTRAYLERAQEQYDWLKVVRSPVNLGFAGANNKASRLCDADVLVFLNNDTVVQAAWLEKMLERIDDPGVGMVGSKLIYPDERIQHAGIIFDPQLQPTHIHHLLHRGDAAAGALMEYPAVTGACIMIRRGLFLEVGMMDTEYPMYYEDVDLCFKVREKGLKVVYQPESVVIHLEGRSSANLDAIVKHNEASRAIFLRKWGDSILKGMNEDSRFYAAGREYRPR